MGFLRDMTTIQAFLRRFTETVLKIEETASDIVAVQVGWIRIQQLLKESEAPMSAPCLSFCAKSLGREMSREDEKPKR